MYFYVQSEWKHYLDRSCMLTFSCSIWFNEAGRVQIILEVVLALTKSNLPMFWWMEQLPLVTRETDFALLRPIQVTDEVLPFLGNYFTNSVAFPRGKSEAVLSLHQSRVSSGVNDSLIIFIYSFKYLADPLRPKMGWGKLLEVCLKTLYDKRNTRNRATANYRCAYQSREYCQYKG